MLFGIFISSFFVGPISLTVPDSSLDATALADADFGGFFEYSFLDATALTDADLGGVSLSVKSTIGYPFLDLDASALANGYCIAEAFLGGNEIIILDLNSQQDKLKDLHKVLLSLAPTIKHG
jgi:hypothetical protein